MKKWTDYNWRGDGPSGCDSHCIPHPCGPCMAPELRPTFYHVLAEYDRIKKVLQELQKEKVNFQRIEEINQND